MNDIKGYGFRPSDEELIGYLEDITFDRDSLVQYITQLQDICQFEPRELPGLSALQPGCKVWYFIYSLNYKYRKGKLIKRVTKEGHWKPTGRRRLIKASDSKAVIGSKGSLTFHLGHPTGKSTKKRKSKHDDNINTTEHGNNQDKTKHGRSNNRNKAAWVMHEYQLNTATPPNQKTFLLGKLMKQSEDADISNKNGKSSHDLPSNLRNRVENHVTTPEAWSDSDKLLPELEASIDSGAVQNESSTNEQDDDETFPQENQHDFADENEISNLISNQETYSAVDAISKVRTDTDEWLMTEPESPNGRDVVQNQFSTVEQDNPYQSLTVVDDNKTYPEEKNIAAKNVCSDLPANDLTDLIDFDLSNVEEILKLIETADNCNVFQNQSSTNEQDADRYHGPRVGPCLRQPTELSLGP